MIYQLQFRFFCPCSASSFHGFLLMCLYSVQPDSCIHPLILQTGSGLCSPPFFLWILEELPISQSVQVFTCQDRVLISCSLHVELENRSPFHFIFLACILLYFRFERKITPSLIDDELLFFQPYSFPHQSVSYRRCYKYFYYAIIFQKSHKVSFKKLVVHCGYN